MTANLKTEAMMVDIIALRSALFVPADNERALAKVRQLRPDAVIFDLEDAVAPENKVTARENLRTFLGKNGALSDFVKTIPIIIRINPLSEGIGAEDLMLARALKPHAILLPKVSHVGDIAQVEDMLIESDAPHDLKIWAMIETARGLNNIAAIASHASNHGSRLEALAIGPNDICAETGIMPDRERRGLMPHLAPVVIAAKANQLFVLDGVFNTIADLDGLKNECQQGRDYGFDGKTIIHPSHIAIANEFFGPSVEQVASAELIIKTFSEPENATKNAIRIEGRMVERLHYEHARKLITKVAMLNERS